MGRSKKTDASDEAWDSGQLGRNAEFVRVSAGLDESKIDQAIGLTPVSIRLQQSLIEDFKVIAKFNGIGYQPLMRQVLTRFAEAEKKSILRDLLVEQGRDIEIEPEPEKGLA
jgi:predicted DNA binding CopG/RHH family protein